MSQRDVPGLTRNAIPILASEGVRVLSVGVNGGSAPPAVPFNTPFWWRDEPSSTQLLAFWHPGEHKVEGGVGCPLSRVEADGALGGGVISQRHRGTSHRHEVQWVQWGRGDLGRHCLGSD